MGVLVAFRGLTVASGCPRSFRNTSTNRGSAGCITIHPDDCERVWGVLQEGETGSVTIIQQEDEGEQCSECDLF